MDTLLLKIFLLLRPIFFIDLNVSIGPLNLFEFAAIIFTILLFAATMYNMALSKNFNISGIDILILMFSIWCVTSYLVNLEQASIKEVSRMILPLLTFVIAKNLISNREDYEQSLMILIVGFIFPVMASALLISLGRGIEHVSFWTDIERYKGVYFGAHSMGHNMAFLLITIALYVSLVTSFGTQKNSISKAKKITLSVIMLAAIYCLFQSQVRTAVLGVLVFSIIYFWFYNKRILSYGAIGLLVLGLVFADSIIPRLFADFEKVQTGEWSIGELGSGRPRIWAYNLDVFSKLPIDKIIGGVGVGGSVRHNKIENLGEEARLSHNDYLKILIETGIVGAALFIFIQIAIFNKIKNITGPERYIFYAIFFAVQIMNFISNSYVSRFGLGQMYFFIMSYIEISRNIQNSGKVRSVNQLANLSQ